jgi:hydrogenase-4 component F
MVLVLVLLVLVFVSLLSHLNKMLYGPVPITLRQGEHQTVSLAPLVVGLALVVVLGLTVPGPLARLLTMSAEILAP